MYLTLDSIKTSMEGVTKGSIFAGPRKSLMWHNPTPPGGGDSFVKGSGMLVVSLRGKNQQFGIFRVLKLKFVTLAVPSIF